MWKEGLWHNNVALVQLLGLCPLLAVTVNAANGLLMGVATLAVLVASNVCVSLVRGIVPKEVRLPVFILVIAGFVTLVDMLMAAYMPGMHRVLGLYVPLIVVNCAILGRTEVFASKNPVREAALDGLFCGAGFAVVLGVIGTLREFLGQGMVFGHPLTAGGMVVFVLPPGAFFVLGFLVAARQYYVQRLQQPAAGVTAQEGA
ncbi:MAG: RnfABCDGE type electron transport complex subunit E [Proteobacteria bacterium]|nr:RnfABCDGE type electron transport complex subunit E [Pseudomonadota bacterium]